MAQTIGNTTFLLASQAEHEGSIPFTCSREKSPGILDLQGFSGLFSFAMEILEIPKIHKKKRLGGGNRGGKVFLLYSRQDRDSPYGQHLRGQ